MATRRWLGAAQAVAQISTVTITGTITVGATYTIQVGNASVIYTSITGDTLTSVAAGLVSLCSDSGAPAEFSDIEWTSNAGVVTATAGSPGQPFTISSSDTDASAAATTASVLASSGPNYWSVAANWSGSTVPVTGDIVIISQSATEILYGLAQSAVLLAELIIESSYTGKIGSPVANLSGYIEYRATYLAIGATKLLIGQGSSRGSQLLKIDLGTNVSTVIISKTDTTPLDGESSCQILAVNVASTINIIEGDLGVARLGEEVSTLAKIQVGVKATVKIGYGVTLATIENAGSIECASNITTWTQDSGKALLFDATLATLTVKGGEFWYFGSATITTATIGPGTLDLSGDLRSRTITTCNLKKGGKIFDPGRTLTATGGFVLDADVDAVTAS